MISVKEFGNPNTWHWREWIPLTEETPAPSITVFEFTGTKQELITHLKERIYDAAENKNIGTLMTFALFAIEEFERQDS